MKSKDKSDGDSIFDSVQGKEYQWTISEASKAKIKSIIDSPYL